MEHQLVHTPFSAPNFKIDVGPMVCVSDVLAAAEIPESFWANVVVTINGTQIDRVNWTTTTLADSDNVSVFVIPLGDDGGKTILRLVAVIAVAVVAQWATPALQFIIGGAATSATGGYIITAGLTLIGTLAINALIPPPSASVTATPGNREESSYYINAQSNQANLLGIVPIVYGSIRMVPGLVTQPTVRNCGVNSLFSGSYDFGLGRLDLTDVRAGDTLVSTLGGGKYNVITQSRVPTWNGTSFNPVELAYVDYPVKYADISVTLDDVNDAGEATTASDTVEAGIEISYPSGLLKFDTDGSWKYTAVTYEVQVRKFGDTEWERPLELTGCAGGHFQMGQVALPEVPYPLNINFDPISASWVSTGDGYYRFLKSGADFNLRLTDAEGDTLFYAILANKALIVWKYAETVDGHTAGDEVSAFDMLFVGLAAEVGGEQYLASWRPNDKVTLGWIYPETNRDRWEDSFSQPFPERLFKGEPIYIDTSGATTKPSVPTPPEVPQDPNELFDDTPGNETYVKQWSKRLYGSGQTFSASHGELWVNGVMVQYLYIYDIDQYKGAFVYPIDIWVDSPYEWKTDLYSLHPSYYDGGVAIASRRTIEPRDIDPFWEVSVSGHSTQPGTISLFIKFMEVGQWDVRVKRTTPKPTSDDRIVSNSVWSRLTSYGNRFDEDKYGILNLKHQHTLLDLRFEASEQVEGNVNQINAMAHSHLRYRKTGINGWYEKITSNPAWVVLDILTGYSIQNRGKMPTSVSDTGLGWIDLEQIDIDSFITFADFCDETVAYFDSEGTTVYRLRHSFNHVLATEDSIITTCQNILAQSKARLIIGQNGLITIFRDEVQETSRQLFTPANSWGFKASRSFIQEPHALRVGFLAPELNFQPSEVVVYRPGYTEANSDLYEDVSTFGVTNYDEAGDYGMYLLAQGVYRSETFTINCEAEFLVCQVGDKVEIQHDVPLLGGEAVYVKTINGNIITIDRALGQFDAPVGYTLRTSGGNVVHGDVVSQTDDIFEVSSADIGLFASADLVVLGTIKSTNFVTEEYLVTSITPSAGLTASVNMIKYDERVLDPFGSFPAWDPGFGDEAGETTALKTRFLKAGATLVYNERLPYNRVGLTWQVYTGEVSGGTPGAFIIGFRPYSSGSVIPIAQVAGDIRSYTHEFLTGEGEYGNGYYIVTPISQLGYTGTGAEIYLAELFDTEPPVVPPNFEAEWLPSGVTQLTWGASTEPDHDGYYIYVADTNVGVNGADFLMKVGYEVTSYIHQDIGEQYFYIVAVDTSGNLSSAAWDKADYPVPDTPENFGISVHGSNILLRWDLLNDRYVNQYRILYNPNQYSQSPNDSGTVDVAVVDSSTNVAAVPPQLGTYFLIAHNIFDKESGPARASTYFGDITITSINISQKIKYVERYPFSDISLSWSFSGAIGLIKEFVVQFQDSQGVVHDYGTHYGNQYMVTFDIVRDTDKNAGTWLITPISIFGQTGGSGTKGFTIIKDSTAPASPTKFFANIVDINVELNWLPSIDVDIDKYSLRYSPKTDGTPVWDTADSLGIVDHNTTSMSVNARTGTYMIAAFDTSGNRSEIEVQYTTVSEIPQINVVEVSNDQPLGWPGGLLNFQISGSHIITVDPGIIPDPETGYELEAVYSVSNFVDLSEVFETRLASKIQARAIGLGDVIANWPTLTSVNKVGDSQDLGEWDAWAEYRVSDSPPPTLAEWPTLADPIADPIGGVDEIIWSDWRRFYVVDTTGRFYQFRIIARSFNQSTAVIIDDDLIELDMPDRIWSVNDVAIPAASTQINFDPPFKGVKAISVSIDGNSDPVVAEITNRTSESFNVTLINTVTTNAVAGQIDVIAVGYGRLRPSSIT